jgi:hypothetical protein
MGPSYRGEGETQKTEVRSATEEFDYFVAKGHIMVSIIISIMIFVIIIIIIIMFVVVRQLLTHATGRNNER